MLPRHAKTGFFLKKGFLDGVTTFSDLEKRISLLSSDDDKGDAFEVFAEAYLVTQQVMQASEVWPFEKIPSSKRRELRLTKKDMGIDGVFQTTLNEHHAYQVKFRTGRPRLQWRELATCIGSSKKCDKVLVFTNSNYLPPIVEEMEEVYAIRGNDLDRLEARDFQQMLNWLKKTEKPRPRKEPRKPDQEMAIEAITSALAGTTSKRATAVMACGTGKTLIALWVAERLGYKKVLVLVPSLALLSQTLRDWMRDTSWENLSYICVCSDSTVTRGADNWEVRQADLPFPVGTDSGVVEEFLSKRTGGVKVVFSTYQSAKVVAQGLTTKTGFDLGIFDEAHKTAGREGRNFAFALDDANLPIKRRLFLTATPKHYNVLQKDKEGESKLVYSMDDEGTYGPRVYELPFSEAARLDIICGYKVLISVVTSDEVNEDFLRRGAILVKGDEVRARQVANHLALKRATEKTPVKKAFTFHTFVSYAASFTAEGGEGLRAHLPSFETYHVSGAMSTATREERLHEFEDAKKAVMSNARCLTEGVNVPVVDMVAFMSPKKSRVDIVQATGRAMRKAGKKKKKGYILIPLFLQKAKKESIEDALERTDFSEVWDVLQAMAEQDSELTEIISEMVFEKASKKTKGYDDQKFRGKVEVLGPAVSLDKLRAAITVRCVEKLGVSWDQRYGELVAYKEEHGNCNVDRYYLQYPELGGWVHTQRTAYTQKWPSLTEDRIKKLEDIGFIWNVYESQWEEMFEELAAYKKKHHHCDVPYLDPEYPDLGVWVGTQRTAYRQKRPSLSKDNFERLEGLGFKWSLLEDIWDKRFRELVTYERKYHNCNVPNRYPDNPELGVWVGTQRILYRRKSPRLTEDRIKKLEDIGFVWEPLEAAWEEMYQELFAYQNKYHHCNVSAGDPEFSKLGRWVGTQRRAYDKRLSEERIKRLEDIGFIWNALDAAWEEMFQELVAYKEKFHHCNVSAGDPQYSKLARWTVTQRKAYKNRSPRMTEKRIMRLEDIGFMWNALEAAWEEMFQELVAYKQKCSSCNVSARDPEYSELARWVYAQRLAYKKKSSGMTEDRIRRLEDIGFVWNALETSWDEMFQELVAYKNKYQHCNVSAKDPQHSKLGRWVGTQRLAYKKKSFGMTEDRIKRLEDIGFVWQRHEAAWEEMFQELIAYEEKYHHCNVPNRYPENPELGLWVGTQRTLYRRKGRSLTEDRIKKLEDIGFVWEPHETAWEKMFRELVAYEEKYHHCNVSTGDPRYSKLATWVSTQRFAYKKNSSGLTEERIKRLEDIGFIWNVYESQWEEMFQELVAYKKKYHHCNVSPKDPYYSKLGMWVITQRNSYGTTMPEERRKRLEDIGFVWKP